jgi:ABC-type uncharacterized transport system ATPase component
MHTLLKKNIPPKVSQFFVEKTTKFVEKIIRSLLMICHVRVFRIC